MYNTMIIIIMIVVVVVVVNIIIHINTKQNAPPQASFGSRAKDALLFRHAGLYLCIHTYTNMSYVIYMCMYIYIYIERERERYR